jgi:excisionase family DNA binding protein
MSDNRLVFTVDEARQLLGLSRELAYAAVRSGEIPSIRIGRRLLIPRRALMAMLDQSGSPAGPPDLAA